MKKICVIIAIVMLSGCGYHKDAASFAQTYDDYWECSKEAKKQERALEDQCMAKRGYQGR